MTHIVAANGLLQAVRERIVKSQRVEPPVFEVCRDPCGPLLHGRRVIVKRAVLAENLAAIGLANEALIARALPVNRLDVIGTNG